MTFTKEQLVNQAREEVDFWRERDEVIPSQQTAIRLRLAEITLAALTAEPVAYMYKDNLHTDARFSLHTRFGNWSQEDINEYEITEIPLYAAPPAPVVTAEIRNRFRAEGLAELLKDVRDYAPLTAEQWETLTNNWHQTFVGLSGEGDACRAAMLQGAEPVQEWIPCSERMPNPKAGVMVGCRFGREWAVKWATYLPYHPDAHKSGFLMPGGSWTPTHWMPIPAAPQQEVKS